MKADELALWRRYKEGDEAAHEELMLRYLYLVKRQVSKKLIDITWANAEDLMQEGAQGLMTAISKYDFERGSNFKNYAETFILGAIVRNPEVIRDGTRHQYENNYRKARKAHDELMEELGRKPTIDEIVERSRLTPTKVMNALNAASIAFPKEIPDDYAESASGRNPVEIEDEKILLRELLLNLSEKEALIVIEHELNGLEDREIAGKFGLNEEAVKKARQRAMKKLQEMVKA
jgi:RNA polymerase sigma factor (sigma-70 family)